MAFAHPGTTVIPMPMFDVAPVAGGRSTLRIPVGSTYRKLILTLTDAGGGRTTAEIAADIARAVLRVGSEVKWDLQGDELVYLQAEFYQAGTVSPGNNGVLPLYFARDWMEPVTALAPAPFTDQDGPSYGTQGEDSFTLEIEWDGASGCTGIVATAEIGPVPTPLGTHITWLPKAQNLAGAGQDIVQDLPVVDGEGICAFHIGDANVTDVELRVNQTNVRMVTLDELNEMNLTAGRLPDANFASLDMLNRNRFSDALPLLQTAKPYEIRTTFGVAPGDYRIIIEQIRNQVVRQVSK